MSGVEPLKFELHIEVEKTAKAVDLLLQYCESGEISGKKHWSKQALKQVMNQGAVWLTVAKQTSRLRRASKTVEKGQVLHLYYDEKVLNTEVAQAQLIEDCVDYSVWFKPYGMLSQGSKWGDFTTITRFAEQYFEFKRMGFIVHRLDRATSGLILVAHSKKAARALSQMFESRQLDKRYLAKVYGKVLADCTIETPIDDKPAVSHVVVKDYDKSNDISLLEIKIDTGRKHQIRRHLSSIEHSIIGDRLYGNGDNSLDLQLMAYKLSFNCPIEQVPRAFVLPSQSQLQLSNG